MPFKRCQKNGKKGWKYGNSGICYPGKSGRTRARRQAVAIIISQKKKRKK